MAVLAPLRPHGALRGLVAAQKQLLDELATQRTLDVAKFTPSRVVLDRGKTQQQSDPWFSVLSEQVLSVRYT